MRHDDHHGARARSARIRTSHDDEATRLDTMRRNTLVLQIEPRTRTPLLTRLRAALRPATATSTEATHVEAEAGVIRID